MSGSSGLKEKVARLKRQLKDAELEAEMYKTFYRAKHDDIRSILPIMVQKAKTLMATLKKVSDISISECTSSCPSACGDCNYLKIQVIILNCLRQIERIENEFKVEFDDGC